MLTAQGPLLSPNHRPRRSAERAFLLLSMAMHAVALALLLRRPAPGPAPTLPPIEVELVQQPAQIRGAPPHDPGARPAPPSPAAAPSPAAPPTDTAPLAPPSPSKPATETRPAPPAPKAAPEVNLGNAAQDLDPLSVTGDNVVPPAPDARYRNQPPAYPAEAARAGAEGTVQLVARVSTAGLPLSVAIASSSGNASLDAEAQRAVSLWRFRPARVGGQAVPYDFVVNIRFKLGER